MELTIEEKSFIIHSAAGTIVGIICGFLGTGIQLTVFALAVLYLLGIGFQKAFKLDPEKQGKKWWLGNGVWPYMVLWLFFWAIVYYVRTG